MNGGSSIATRDYRRVHRHWNGKTTHGGCSSMFQIWSPTMAGWYHIFRGLPQQYTPITHLSIIPEANWIGPIFVGIITGKHLDLPALVGGHLRMCWKRGKNVSCLHHGQLHVVYRHAQHRDLCESLTHHHRHHHHHHHHRHHHLHHHHLLLHLHLHLHLHRHHQTLIEDLQWM